MGCEGKDLQIVDSKLVYEDDILLELEAINDKWYKYIHDKNIVFMSNLRYSVICYIARKTDYGLEILHREEAYTPMEVNKIITPEYTIEKINIDLGSVRIYNDAYGLPIAVEGGDAFDIPNGRILPFKDENDKSCLMVVDTDDVFLMGYLKARNYVPFMPWRGFMYNLVNDMRELLYRNGIYIYKSLYHEYLLYIGTDSNIIKVKMDTDSLPAIYDFTPVIPLDIWNISDIKDFVDSKISDKEEIRYSSIYNRLQVKRRFGKRYSLYIDREAATLKGIYRLFFGNIKVKHYAFDLTIRLSKLDEEMDISRISTWCESNVIIENVSKDTLLDFLSILLYLRNRLIHDEEILNLSVAINDSIIFNKEYNYLLDNIEHINTNNTIIHQTIR